ncbi:MAG: ATP synthase F0 subunit C [Bradymonadaceae bacterium]
MLKKKLLAFSGTLLVLGLWSSMAFAQQGGAPGNGFTMFSWFAIAAGFGVGIAAFGGGLGQGRAAAAALEGIARNPGAADEVFAPLLLSLALIESLVIYALVVAILIVLKLDVTQFTLTALQ